MHLDLLRDTSTSFPQIESPMSVRTLRVWHCKYKSLSQLVKFSNLEELAIAGLPDSSLDMFEALSKLRYLSIVHMPKITDLGPLANLTVLESLSLATSPAWDAAKKCTIVRSLEPLGQLPSLKHVELFGVHSEDKSLAALEKCALLKTGRFSQYPQEEIERFYAATEVVNQFNPLPSF